MPVTICLIVCSPNKGKKVDEKKEQKKHILITELKNEWVAFNAIDVIEILEFGKVPPVPMSPPFIEGITQLRGEIVTVVKLEDILQFKASIHTEDTRIVIIRNRNMLLGIIVDKVHEMCKVNPDVFGGSSDLTKANSNMYNGVFKMDNHLINILDLDKLCIFLNMFNYA